MNRLSLYGILSLFAMTLAAPSAWGALVITKTNNTFGSVDGSSDTRTVDIVAGDITMGTGTILSVTATLDFSKCPDKSARVDVMERLVLHLRKR